MKKIIIIGLLSAIYHISNAQNYVLSPLGIKFPNYTTATRPAANSLGAGTVLYNSTDNVLQFSQGSSWLNFGLPSGLVNQTLRNNGSGWVADGLMQNDGSRILIGLSNYDLDGLLRVNVGNGSTGIYVTSTDNPGIYAQSTVSSAVSGFSTSGNAIYGQSTAGTGLAGVSTNGPGISASSTNGIGISAYSATKQAIYATGVGYPAIYATSQNTGVLADGGYAGIQGSSVNGTGMIASSTNGIALQAVASNSYAVQGISTSGTGIYGSSNSGLGLWGASSSSFGLYATSTSSYGIYGTSQTNTGIKGTSGTSYGGEFIGRVRVGKGGNGDAGIEFEKSTGLQGGYIGMNGDNEMMIYGYPYGAIQRWNINSGSICYATSPAICSDIRLKKNFRDLSNSLASITQLKGYNYYLRNEKNPNLQTGFIAQEIQKIFPELVNTGSDGYLSVDYTGLIPHLVESVKALKSENNDLKERLFKIESFLKISESKIEVNLNPIKTLRSTAKIL
jgi:Chaperone of endosialidase